MLLSDLDRRIEYLPVILSAITVHLFPYSLRQSELCERYKYQYSKMEVTQASLKEQQQKKLKRGFPLRDCYVPPSPEESHLLAASHLWGQAQKRSISEELKIKYGGGIAVARPDKGDIWIDRCARVLVGWHGTTQPPRGMEANDRMNFIARIVKGSIGNEYGLRRLTPYSKGNLPNGTLSTF